MTDTTIWAIVEEWRAVVGFEGVYEVSDLGHVRRIGRAHKTGKGQGGGARIGRVLKDQPLGNGYRVVQLWKEGVQYGRLVHVLVAGAFLGPCPAGMEVNHKNGREKWNNSVSNLEYVTHSQNSKHAYDTGLRFVTAAQRAALERRPHQRQPRVMTPCACGCGAQIETPDKKGRRRRYVVGHGAKAKS